MDDATKKENLWGVMKYLSRRIITRGDISFASCLIFAEIWNRAENESIMYECITHMLHMLFPDK